MTQKQPRRRGLNDLMESVAAKLAARPDHIAAAKVLEEMNTDAARQAQEKKQKETESNELEQEKTQKLSAQTLLADCPPKDSSKIDRTKPPLVSSPEAGQPLSADTKPVTPQESKTPSRRKAPALLSPSEWSHPRPSQKTSEASETPKVKTATSEIHKPHAETRAHHKTNEQAPAKSKKTVTLRSTPPPVHGGNAVKLFKWLFQTGKNNTIDLTLPIAEQATGVDPRSCRRILADWVASGVCEKSIHRRGVHLRLLLTEKEALGVASRKKSTRKGTPTDELEKALPDLCPHLVEAGFTPKHLRRIRELLAMQQLEPDGLPEALRYAEFELEHNQMIDSRGEPVSSPVDWVFRCLSKDGTYRIPKKYLSQAERRRHEREEMLRRERETLDAEQALLREEASLELEKEVEALFQQVLAAPESELAAQFLNKVPGFLREKGLANPLVQRACRMQISISLNRASKVEKT